jgi:integrase
MSGRVWVRRRKGRKGRPWVCAWERPGQKRQQRTFRSREDAEHFGAEKRLEVEQAAPVTQIPPGITIKDYSELWLTAAGPGLKPRTLASYRQILAHHVLPQLGAVEVRELHQRTVADLLAGKLARFKVGTARLIYATLRRLLSRAIFDGVIRDNPAASVWRELPIAPAKRRATRRRGKDQVPAMTEEQSRATLDAATRHRALFATLAFSGLRIGEALALQPDDVGANELHVRRTLAPAQKDGASLEDRLGTPKSGEVRSVSIGAHLSSVLRDHIAAERERHFKAGRSFVWLFSTREGTPLDETRVRKAFKAAVKAAGLPARFTVHSLRHSYASQMIAKGAPITWVSAQLGHASVQTTLDFYAWALPQGDNRLASLLDPVATRLDKADASRDQP